MSAERGGRRREERRPGEVKRRRSKLEAGRWKLEGGTAGGGANGPGVRASP